MNIRYVGPARDYSGYGEATRHDIAALLEAGVIVTSKVPKYVPEIADFGAIGERVINTENRVLPYDVSIIHTTPNVYKLYLEPGKYHIGRVFWETDRLPKEFADNVELCDEIWTGSEYNKKAIQESGVTKPIYVIPEAIDTSLDIEAVKPYRVINENDYKFYSIFEWTERKNPVALLKAFWTEFEKDEDVSLTLKTYIDNFDNKMREEIDYYMHKIKDELALSRYAKVYLKRELMDREQIYRFHKSFDCFVSAHRGEGWGIPQMEAALFNNPVISTNCGGIHEYLTHGLDALLPSYASVQLSRNSRNHQWYTPDQKWAEVDPYELRQAMRFMYSHKEEGKAIGVAGGNTVRAKFNLKTVGELMKKRLLEIEEHIGNNRGTYGQTA